QARLDRVLADDADPAVLGQAGGGGAPGLSEVVGDVDVGAEVVQAVAVDGGEGGARRGRRGGDLGQAAPVGEAGRSDVPPALAAVAGEADQPVVGAHPDEVALDGGGRDGRDHAVAARLGAGGGDVGRAVGGPGDGAGEVRAHRLPVVAAVGRAEEHLGAEVEGVRRQRGDGDRGD